MDEKVMRYMTIRLLDMYVMKKEAILRSGDNPQKDAESTAEYDLSFPLILENVSDQC